MTISTTSYNKLRLYLDSADIMLTSFPADKIAALQLASAPMRIAVFTTMEMEYQKWKIQQ